MKKAVLVVEDDARISELVRDYFTRDFDVVLALNGAQALIEFEARKFDLIILDIMLPILDGWEVCRQVRGKSNIPIIMLTAKSDELSNLKGYELGVDDYVTKPFSPRVLLARVNAIFKRLENAQDRSCVEILLDNGLKISEASHRVSMKGDPVNLSATEFSLLLFLVKNRGTVFTRDAILDHVWGENYFGDYRIVDTNIKRLREKLGQSANCLQTVRGVGYCLVEE